MASYRQRRVRAIFRGALKIVPKEGAEAQSKTLIWFHGGAYVSGSNFTHRGLLGRLARAGRCEVIGINYPLAPENPAPAAFDAGLAAISSLGLPSGQLILGGDSAGGGLAAALAAHLCARGQAPCGMVLLSPWTDLTLSGASIRTNAQRDALIPVKPMAEAARQICGAFSPQDPRISPHFAAWPQTCPVLFQVGTTEVLLDDTLRLAEALRLAGAKVLVSQLDDAPHVLAFFAPWVPEALAAIAEIGGFIRGLSAPPPPFGS